MAASNPPVNGVAFIVYVALQDMALPGSYKAAPTIAAGDFQVSIDGGAFANLATLPAVTPAAGRAVKISLSAGEMTGDNIFVQCVDQTNPKEWADYALNIQTVAALPAVVSNIPTAVENADALLARNVSGGSSAGRTVKQALHLLRNKRAVAAGTLTVYETDDAATSWTATVGTTAGDPTSSIDPG